MPLSLSIQGQIMLPYPLLLAVNDRIRARHRYYHVSFVPGRSHVKYINDDPGSWSHPERIGLPDRSSGSAYVPHHLLIARNIESASADQPEANYGAVSRGEAPMDAGNSG
jgi:hypothetical protein